MTATPSESADAAVVRALSAARMRLYLDETSGCVADALRLYRWNVERTVASARRVLAAIDPAVEQWWVGGQRVTGVLARRPFPPAAGLGSVR